jgi:hypothetical protein
MNNKVTTEPNDPCVKFDVVYSHEIDCILQRRAEAEKLEPVKQPSKQPGDDRPASIYDKNGLIGLALSGGGIRSAAFSLGVLQALDETHVLKRVDYLSTVSGGGYIGSSLSAGMSKYGGKFPFESQPGSEETPSVRHIRDYSNYLMPHGKMDILQSLVIYLRGIVANIILVLPWLLLPAAWTVWTNPTRQALGKPNVGFSLALVPPFSYLHLEFFIITTCLLLVLLFLFGGWALYRSGLSQRDKPEVPSWLTRLYGWLVFGTAVMAFCELQPFVLAKIGNAGSTWHKVTTWLQGIGVALAPGAAIIAFVGKQLEAIIKRASEAPSGRVRAAGLASKFLLYVAAAAAPLFLWAIFFQLAWWGIANNDGPPPSPQWLESLRQLLESWTHWMSPILSGWLFDKAPIAGVYFIFFLVLLALSMLLRPNANSLHRLYRDRLSKAFLFKPVPEPTTKDADLKALDGYKLSKLDVKKAPYHLINTALNIQGSKHVNRRGRNADFFMFSHGYVGSESTGYVATTAMEEDEPELNLGTAMAISAAAASPNMGTNSIKPLTITLALLNVRVGFWLRNPRAVGTPKGWAKVREFFPLYFLSERLRNLTPLYFLWELLGNLTETSRNIYVTDGGHVENLGLYELLKRKCKVIIVVDAETDPKMTFESFMVVQRYALIDHGVRIDLPLQSVRDRTLAVNLDMEEKGETRPKTGPHCAVGEIDYGHGTYGIIIYIKSSVTGDENDYTLFYKSRNPAFPQEGTGDQFFSEEQFEVYRALGFHVGYGLFDRRDEFAHPKPSKNPRIRDHLDELDRLFPRNSGHARDPSQQHKKFADYLSGRKTKATTAVETAPHPHDPQ